ncbi:pseudouridylate synthase RPUSD4, mitochondrial [Centroberyx gerrardi]|uniref:pseudouridylate synthase RPUSD4, mitochondrial-like n=1 Tax=Centroberyx gerrardi TaxID=166262 RepID=UPI003AAAF0F8
MNRCRRITDVCTNDWSYVLNTVFSRGETRTNRRLPTESAPFLSRTHATAAKHVPSSDSEKKPRLRAIDLARKIEQDKTKAKAAAEPPVSAQDKRVTELKQFTLQLQKVHPNVLAKHLHRSMLFQDKDLVVINKPYGVPVQDGSGVTSISSVLPVLSKMMDGTKSGSGSPLFPCLGLEKEATGTLLLARSEEVADHILNLYKNNQVQRKYWVVTVGVPVPSEGVIDIPVIEREVTGPQPHFKMALSPAYRMNDTGDGITKVRGHRQAHGAVTKYRVLDSSSGCSLVELQPFTGVKHQMRVHMAFALACPILGDHKYSHWAKLAPQKLPERVLGRLGLEQSKIRHLPLHLHARQLILPRNSQPDISVSCPLPKYFTKTLSRLQLVLSEETEPE